MFFGIFFLCWAYTSHANIFTKTQIDGIELQYVIYDVGSEIYNLKVAVSDDAVSIQDLAQEYNAITAINGVFFCPADYSQCNGDDYTINERFVNGQDLSFYKKDTGERAVFWWDKDGVPLLHKTWKINQNLRGHIFEWLWNFPILYANGIDMLPYYKEVGLYDSKMKAHASRHFICSDKEKKYIIFWRSSWASLEELSPTLQKIWCWDALNLDAWNSSQFLYNNNKLVSGKRNIIDGFVIERKWLSTWELESQLDSIFDYISPLYKKYPKDLAIEQLSGFISVIEKIRHDIYVQWSLDLYDDVGNIIWYQIQIHDIELLKRLYLINGIERKIRELRWEIQNS